MQLDSDVSKNASPKPPYKQTSIVTTIICLTFLSQASIDERQLDLLITIPAAVLFILSVLLAEYKGRKLLVITLLVMSTLSSMAFLPVYIPEVGEPLQSAVRAATAVQTGVVLCEYSEPRHRIIYLMVHAMTMRISCWTYTLYAVQYPGIENYLLLFKLALGIICIGSVFTWPESPYWLASKGNFEEARKAFAIVRGDTKSTELQELIETQQQRGTAKMFLAPLLFGVPVIFTLSTNYLTLELNFMAVVWDLFSTKSWLYFGFNIIVSAVYIFASIKLSRRRLLFMSSLLSIVCIGLFVLYLYFVTSLRSVEIFLTFASYLIVIGAFTCVNYTVAIEMIPCKNNNVISCVLGLIYLLGELAYPYIQNTFIMLIGFCLIVNPITAYFILPELKGKSKIEIEQAYRPKQVQHGPTEL